MDSLKQDMNNHGPTFFSPTRKRAAYLGIKKREMVQIQKPITHLGPEWGTVEQTTEKDYYRKDKKCRI